MAAYLFDQAEVLDETVGAIAPIDALPIPQSPGDDTVVVTATTTGYGTLDGGAGTDTLQLNPASPPTVTNGPNGPYSLSVGVFNNATTLISFERFLFNSTVNSVMSAQFAFGGNSGALNQIGTGLAANSEIVGGAGLDVVTLIYNSANLPGTVTAPSFTYTNWTTSARAYQTGDRVSIVVTGSGATTINGTAHTGIQSLSGGGGNDTINGSDDMDNLSGGPGGSDTLHGNGGNDTLSLMNGYFIFNGVANAESTQTGVGSLYDGGSGTDFLALGGNVNFQGTLQSIEGIFLSAGYTNLNNTGQPLNTGSQYNTRAVFSSATFAALPSNLELDGAGTIVVNLGNAGETFTGAGFTFDVGSNVVFEIYGGNGTDTITGTSNGDYLEAGLGNDALFGGNGDDTIQFGSGNQTATGGAGADHFRVGLVQGTVTDFTIGTDKIDFSDTDISNMGRVRDLLSQGVNGATLSADTGGLHYEMVLQGISSASLSDSDFLLGSANQGPYIETGTALQDYQFGGTFNDIFHGGDGNDRIYGGGGIDQLFGEGGNDTLIVDGQVAFGGTYDGGAGIDTLLLRNYHTNNTVTLNGPGSTYLLFGPSQANFTGIERMQFDSEVGTSLAGVISAPLIPGSGITELIGGAGTDSFVVLVLAGGTYTMGSYTLTNWNGEDALVLFTNNTVTANVTLNASALAVKQVLVGSSGNDTLNGSGGNDTLDGGAGDDILSGGAGINTYLGGAGNDRLVIGTGANGSSIDGGTETDTLAVSGTVGALASVIGIEAIELTGGASLTLTNTQFSTGLALGSTISGTGSLVVNMAPTDLELNLNTLVVLGGSSITVTGNGSTGDDTIKGINGAVNTLNGGDGNDQIRGGGLADIINGGNGNDKLFGAGGADIMTGGAGADIFRFQTVASSGVGAAADQITDFLIGTDKLGFAQIDTDPTTPGDQAFAFIGTSAFGATGVAQMRYMNSGANLLIQADIFGDGIADMEVVLQGLAGQTLTGASFLL
jgi:Ca2+-binding RTX toxin-like protein